MKQINEIKRMQQLAGLITESQLNEETVDITYGRNNNSVNPRRAMDFIEYTLEKRGYDVPKEILKDMLDNGVEGDLFGVRDPNDPYTKDYTDWPTVDYYKKFNEEKAIEMVREYIDMMMQYPENFANILPYPVTSLDSYKV